MGNPERSPQPTGSGDDEAVVIADPDPAPDEYLPTAEEVAEACEAIRAGWSPKERERRAGGPCPSPSP